MPGVVAVLTADDLPLAGGSGRRRGAAGARGDRVVGAAGRAGDRGVRGRRRGRRGARVGRGGAAGGGARPRGGDGVGRGAVAGDRGRRRRRRRRGRARRRRRRPTSRARRTRPTWRPSRGCSAATWTPQLARADAVVSGRFRTNWIHQAYLEPQSTLAWVDPDGTLVVHSSTQGAFMARQGIAELLGLLDGPRARAGRAAGRRVRRQADDLRAAGGGRGVQAAAAGAARLPAQRGLRRRQPGARAADRPRAGRHARAASSPASAGGSSATAAGWGRWASSRSRPRSRPARTAGPRTT